MSKRPTRRSATARMWGLSVGWVSDAAGPPEVTCEAVPRATAVHYHLHVHPGTDLAALAAAIPAIPAVPEPGDE